MPWLKNFFFTLGTVAALNGCGPAQWLQQDPINPLIQKDLLMGKDDSTYQLLDTLQKSSPSTSSVEVIAENFVSIEELDWDDWYPLGTVIIQDTDKTSIMKQLWEKYIELYNTDAVPISFEAMNDLDSIVTWWVITIWSRVWFSTQNGNIIKIYIYKNYIWTDFLPADEQK
jgi:hypothetical protein